MRETLLLTRDWHFHKGDIAVPRPTDKGPVYMQSKTERKLVGPAAFHYADQADSDDQNIHRGSDFWQMVDLPHDYIIDQDNCPTENNANGYFRYDNAWYRKHFTVDKRWLDKRVTLQFDGIAGMSTVYLNGCLLKHNFSSYNSFEIDVSAYLRFGKENVLAVYVNTEQFEGWWYQGGGIYRNVRLVATNKVAIDLYGVYAPAVRTGEHSWQVAFETTVLNSDYAPCPVRAESRILDKRGHAISVASGEGTVQLQDKLTLRYTAAVEDPELWDIDSPALYTVETTLYSGDTAIDADTTRIGFRTVTVSPEEGLFLNGRHVKINGVCAHQDFGLTGLAVPDNVARYKVQLYKEMGANGFRTSHYQNCTATMDALDEMGFLVMDEARWFEVNDEAVEQMETLVKRDRNRPSVIFWSTGNEEPCMTTEMGRRIHLTLKQKILKLDRTRLITSACNWPYESTIFADCDVIGINYNLHSYDKVHATYPQIPVLASECCATGTTRDWNMGSNWTLGRLVDRDTDSSEEFLGREKTWKFLNERPYIIGGYQWAATEHRGEAVWPTVCSKSGALDLFLQRKGAFYQNQSLWTRTPMAHILNHWNLKGMENEPVEVWVYTNCDELELFLNGKSCGRKAIEPFGHGQWTVPYAPGRLEVKGYRNGILAAEDCRQTSKAPARLRLTMENSCRADGQELAIFTCTCVDEDGLYVPDAAEYVTLSVEAPARLVGTGSDNCDHIRVTEPSRQMYAGRIAVAVRPEAGQESLTLYARSAACGLCRLRVQLET